MKRRLVDLLVGLGLLIAGAGGLAATVHPDLPPLQLQCPLGPHFIDPQPR